MLASERLPHRSGLCSAESRAYEKHKVLVNIWEPSNRLSILRSCRCLMHLPHESHAQNALRDYSRATMLPVCGHITENNTVGLAVLCRVVRLNLCSERIIFQSDSVNTSVTLLGCYWLQHGSYIDIQPQQPHAIMPLKDWLTFLYNYLCPLQSGF